MTLDKLQKVSKHNSPIGKMKLEISTIQSCLKRNVLSHNDSTCKVHRLITEHRLMFKQKNVHCILTPLLFLDILESVVFLKIRAVL